MCGDIKRFINFPVPCLLIYDIEDDGHPIAQGKLLNKYLKFSRLLTFKTSKEPYWIADHLWESVLEFLRKFDEGLAKRSSSLNQDNKHKGGIIPSEIFDQNDIYEFNLLHVRNHHSEEKMKNFKQKDFQQKTFMNEKKTIFYENEEKKVDYNIKEENSVIKINEISKENHKIYSSNNKNIENISEEEENKKKLSPNKKNEEIIEKNEKIENNKKVSDMKFFEQKSVPNKKVQEIKKDQITAEKIPMKEPEIIEEVKKNEIIDNKTHENNYLCSVCLEIYYKPIELICHHNFCLPCLNDLAFYESRCPLCRKEFPENYDKSERNLNQKLIEEMKEKLPEKKLIDRAQKAILDQQKQSKKLLFMSYGYEFKEIPTKPRVGNAQSAKKYEWKVFLKQINFTKQNMIKYVEFDINVGIIGSKPIRLIKHLISLKAREDTILLPISKSLGIQDLESHLMKLFKE